MSCLGMWWERGGFLGTDCVLEGALSSRAPGAARESRGRSCELGLREAVPEAAPRLPPTHIYRLPCGFGLVPHLSQPPFLFPHLEPLGKGGGGCEKGRWLLRSPDGLQGDSTGFPPVICDLVSCGAIAGQQGVGLVSPPSACVENLSHHLMSSSYSPEVSVLFCHLVSHSWAHSVSAPPLAGVWLVKALGGASA